MALISIILIVVGFILSVYAGVVLSLPNKMQASTGELNQSKTMFMGILMSVAVIMIIAGVWGYYWMRDNLPYYLN